MLQFLRFEKLEADNAEFNIISGYEAFKFFTKRFFYLILLPYATSFIAAIEPFVNSFFELWVYFLGAMITGIFILRFINYIIKYLKYKNGRILISQDSIKIFYKDDEILINAIDITYLEVNILSNLIIREKDKRTSFPIVLLTDEDRKKILSIFNDIAPRRTAFLKKIWDLFDALLVAFILAMHIREFIIQAYYIPTGSMEDTLLVGDHLMVEKITYGPVFPKIFNMEKPKHLDFIGLRGIERGDIVIFRPPDEEEKDFIKRCIAVQGDELHIENGYVYVNGQKIDEPYIKGTTSYRGFSKKRIEGIVPEGMVVVLGDNRENSFDSRGFGYLPIERIKGRAFVLYWNTEHIKNLDFSRYGLIR
ncbi:MAG: signal peptidase I [Spirochaetota bacterium]|nr:signal peptidase I [Spirochaetota bacterium]